MMTENSNMIDITISKDVLIVGAGSTGLETAAKIAAQGYNVSVIGKKTACARQSGCSDEMLDSVDSVDSGTVNIMQDVALDSVAGVAGDFRVTLVRGEEKITSVFGAVVAAPQYKYVPLNDAYGLILNDRVMSQSQFEDMMADEGGLKEIAGDVAFLSGFAQEGDPIATGRMLNSALSVQKLENCNAYIYAGNVKVGARGLERLFTENRHAGVVCFKPPQMPIIEQNNQQNGGKNGVPDNHQNFVNNQQNFVKIAINDPVLRTDVEIEPDYVVVEEGILVEQDDLDIAKILGIDTDLDGLPPSNNVHRFPVRTNRDGIFIAATSLDSANVALRIKELIGDGTISVAADMAKVDEERCVICLTCYRSCPHGAIFWENGAAVISPAACQGCGICASECPMDAIQIGGFTDDDLSRSVKEAAAAVEGSPSIVAFCCKNSALEAGEAAAQFGHGMPAGFKMIKVPCAGKVDVEFIMKAFVDGADGVMVAACHEGNCKAERGNTYAKWRVNEVQTRLENIGLEKNRLVFTTIASNMAREFAGKVNDFAEKLQE